MKHIQVLDCTLRDGGYCNGCRFGNENIKKITKGLVEANIDIIECGFLTNKVEYNPELTKFTSIDSLKNIIPEERNNKIFVALMNYDEFDTNDLPVYDGTSIDGIRVTFHKKNRIEALEVCRRIKKKGYKVFVQAMVSLSYTDVEFLDLISKMNEIEPYAFYIVDSFGMMKRKDLIRLFYMVEHNLNASINIGFHSHNNMQLAYSNAQSLVDLHTKRSLIIDSSVYGMGRGAGNLNTELFVDYLNDNADGHYNLNPLLVIIDEILNDFYQRNYWGYSLPNYLSAVYNTHPNYAGYLDDKKTLTVENMNEIFKMMADEKRSIFDKSYIEDIYLNYMEKGKVQDEHLIELRKFLDGKKILLIAPGKSSSDEKDKIIKALEQDNIISVGVNFNYQYTDTDFIFLSNLRRYRELEINKREKCIVTSNIPTEQVYLKVKYKDLLSEEEAVSDNAGLMAIKLFMELGVNDILLAGFDGYSYDVRQNYGDSNLSFITRDEVLEAMNSGMSKVLNDYKKRINISFLTESKNIF